ncbi:MAG TPA: protein kinase [Planctomycetota bacterium]|nr:protein kinase [Planctomycetota bacterium]
MTEPPLEPDVPEPFAAGLRGESAAAAARAPAGTPLEHYGRALCRLRIGDLGGARADLLVAEPALGAHCAVELAYVDIRQHARLEESVATLTGLLSALPASSRIRPRALHLIGLALGRLRRAGEALDPLLRAAEGYRVAGDGTGLGQVYDTLGNYYAAQGEAENAATHYALSIAEKATSGDRYGIALTLGSLGRLELRLGSLGAARRCFESDHELSARLGDREGALQMHVDLARLAIEEGALEEAVLHVGLGLSMATDAHDAPRRFYLRKDEARIHLARHEREGSMHDLALATTAAAAARAELTSPASAYHAALLDELSAELQLARGEDDGLRALERCADEYARLRLPDHEIPSRIRLARELARRSRPRSAIECLHRASERARHDSYARYRSRIREAFAELDLAPELDEEVDRLDLKPHGEHGIDGYSTLDLMGEGAFGRVFRAYDPARQRLVALKLLRTDHYQTAGEMLSSMAMLRTELARAKLVDHPGVAQVFALGATVDREPYLVQEYIDGPSLRLFMRAGARDVLTVLGTGAAIAASLDVLHAHGVQHRDLKPENVVLRARSYEPVLVDFGIARLPAPGRFDAPALFIGSLPYAAPEQARGEPTDGRNDVYSLGVILYEWLAGELPHPLGEDVGPLEYVRRVSTTSPRPLGRRRKDLPEPVVEAVHSFLERDVKLRPSAASASRALRALC